MSAPFSVTAIISNLNGMRFLPRLIESLRSQEGVTVEIVVADRESGDGSREYLQSVEGLKIITEPASTGLVAGYHAAVPFATHDLLFFCNEDLWLDRNCLRLLAMHISPEERMGAADPWQWSYDGRHPLHQGVRFYPAFFDRINCFPPRGLNFMAQLNSGHPVPFGCSGAILIHRRMYEETGGWDASFFMDFDDVDFFVKAWQRGWRCVTEPGAKVYHAVGQSTFQAGPPAREVVRRRRVGSESNRATVILKHFSGVSLLWAAVVLGRPLLASVLRLNFAEAAIYVRAIARTCQRWPAIRQFRHANRELRLQSSGTEFFTAAQFQQTRASVKQSSTECPAARGKIPRY